MGPGDGNADVRQRILDVATRLFVSEGYHGISMREIAEAAGVSKAGLYYHFHDKEALFLGVLTDNLERIERIIQGSCGRAVSTRERVSHLIHGIFSLEPERRAIIRLASQEVSHLHPETQRTFARLYQKKFVGQVAHMLEEGILNGELRRVDVKVATWTLLGMFYPLLYPVHQRQIAPTPEVIDQMLDIFFSGVAMPLKAEPAYDSRS